MVLDRATFAVAATLIVAAGCGDDTTDAATSSTMATGGGGAPATTNGPGGFSTSAGGSGAAGGAFDPWTCPDPPFDAPLPASDVAATLIQDGFHFLEGPVWIDNPRALDQPLGWLFFSDMIFAAAGPDGVPPAVIYRHGDVIEPFIDPIGSNGLAVDREGSLFAATHDERSVSRIDLATKARTTIASTYGGDAFNSPNDLVVRSDGIIYFTDPTWQLGNRPQEIPFKGVFRIAPGGTEVSLVADDFGSPNGIALSPDESTLYVADDSNGQIRAFSVASDGSTSGGEVLVTVVGADGMAVDCAGNLYVSSNQGIRVFGSDGTDLGTITVGKKPSNAAFGGADRTTLFITAQDALYSVDLAVPGLP
jgi:gluconolactonase